jgi:cytochrome c oxidase subunit 1
MWEILFSTHHTDVGLLYIVLSVTAFMIGGALALMIRTELFLPGNQGVIPDPNTFNRIMTTHGTNMLFLWLIPFASGIGNYLIPILVRYKDMAWPKLNAVAFWMIPVGMALVWLGMADFTWYATPPYSILRAPGPAAEMWIFGIKILGISSILGSINFIVTILKMKHPDMPLMKTSLLVWATLVTSLSVRVL